jgi:phospholipid:diacylglycerol acyltransferase
MYVGALYLHLSLSLSRALIRYDWRLAYGDLERRDKYFTRLKNYVENMREMNEGRKVVVLCHSMGGNVMTYFFNWIKAKDSAWVHNNLHAVSYIGVPLLGLPKSISSLLSGEMKDTAELGDFLDSIRRALISRDDVAGAMRSFRSIPGMLPRGGRMVWGSKNDEAMGFLVGMRREASSSEESEVVFGAGEGNADQSLAAQAAAEPKNATGQHLHTDGVLGLFREAYPEYMAHIDGIYSYGLARTAGEVQANAKNSSKWVNVLETALPDAKDLKIYCMYGTGLPTERAYFFRRNHDDDAKEVPFVLDSDVSDASRRIKRGVQLSDGDATVPLRSLGFMCTRGWQDTGNRRFNPSQIDTIAREYEDTGNSSFVDKVLRTSTAVDHVDIIGNTELITDVLRLVGKLPGSAAANVGDVCPEKECKGVRDKHSGGHTFHLTPRHENIDSLVNDDEIEL